MMIYYPFDDDPPPRKEPPCGVMLGYSGPATPGKREAPPSLKSKKAKRDVVILVGVKCGLSKAAVARAVGLSPATVKAVSVRYARYLGLGQPERNTALQERFHRLSRTQQKIELGCLAVEAGLSIKFVSKSLGMCRDLLSARKKVREHTRNETSNSNDHRHIRGEGILPDVGN